MRSGTREVGRSFSVGEKQQKKLHLNFYFHIFSCLYINIHTTVYIQYIQNMLTEAAFIKNRNTVKITAIKCHLFL